VRPLEEANEGALLELGALADAHRGSAGAIREVQAVGRVDDEAQPVVHPRSWFPTAA
jgi:hypothetical protein